MAGGTVVRILVGLGRSEVSLFNVGRDEGFVRTSAGIIKQIIC